jgi:hypothetical protein
VAVDDGDALGAQPASMLLLEPGHETTGAGHHPPPRDVLVGHPEMVADRSRRLGEPGFGRDLAVGHDLPG